MSGGASCMYVMSKRECHRSRRSTGEAAQQPPKIKKPKDSPDSMSILELVRARPGTGSPVVSHLSYSQQHLMSKVKMALSTSAFADHLLDSFHSHPVATLTAIFSLSYLIYKTCRERITFFLRSNAKYTFLDDWLAPAIYYGPDLGIDRVLALDGASATVVARRAEGQAYLASKLDDGGIDYTKNHNNSNDDNNNANDKPFNLSSALVDCRFPLPKVCMPLLRELEFSPSPRNFVSKVKASGGQMLQVVDPTGTERPYVGSDAVQTLGVQDFYVPIQNEINKRMDLHGGRTSEAALRFAPTSLTPALEKNVQMLLKLAGSDMEQVRYSLSGSEAVDAALKDVAASSRPKKIIVRFTSAYHGHVSGVSFINCPNHIFLPECSQSSLDFIEKYHHRVAGVVVNPMQHFTGINNTSPPGEKTNASSRIRRAISRDEYARWLHSLQDKCNYCTKYLSRVAFIVDDIYFAFRTPELFSTKYFAHPDTSAALKPNVLILGKGVAAGYPLSAVLGQTGYLNCYDKKYLLQLNKTVGTFAAWHGGIVASNVLLETIIAEDEKRKSILKVGIRQQLQSMASKFDQFTVDLNFRLANECLPIRIRSFSNTFSIDYLAKSFYNSRFPQYLLAEGLFLGNYSTGKFNLNADTSEEDLKMLQEKIIAAAKRMQEHGFFEPCSGSTRTRLMMGIIFRFTRNYLKMYYDQIMEDKHIDIEVSHNHPANKFGHFWSSVGMILFAYPCMFWWGDAIRGCSWFFATHFIRQSGHFFYEHQDRDIEKLKFGHKDASKKEAIAGLMTAGLAYYCRFQIAKFLSSFGIEMNLSVEQYVSIVAVLTVAPHFVEITYQYGWLRGISWALKIITDPFTDLLDFYTHMVIHPKWFLDLKDQRATYRLDIKTKVVKRAD